MLEWIKKKEIHIKYLLFPLALIYWLIIFWRNVLYNYNFFITRKLPTQVISVGNVTTGGTGKTPAVIFLAKHFLKKRKTVAILSRGYGRKTAGTQEVSNGKSNNIDWLNFGDEPSLMAKKLPGVPIVVDENRYRGGIYIIEKFKPDLIILDDAFQHRSLARDIDVVLINSQDQQADHRMFPYGSLREPRKNLKRADFVILSKTNIKTPSSYLIGLTKKIGVPTYFSSFNYVELISPTGEKYKPAGNQKVLALSAIGDPESFYETIEQHNFNIVKKTSFSDHHEYCQSDIDTIKNEKKTFDLVITTEKDMVKIENLNIAGIRIFSLVGDFQLAGEEKDEFFAQLDKKLLNKF